MESTGHFNHSNFGSATDYVTWHTYFDPLSANLSWGAIAIPLPLPLRLLDFAPSSCVVGEICLPFFAVKKSLLLKTEARDVTNRLFVITCRDPSQPSTPPNDPGHTRPSLCLSPHTSLSSLDQTRVTRYPPRAIRATRTIDTLGSRLEPLASSSRSNRLARYAAPAAKPTR